MDALFLFGGFFGLLSLFVPVALILALLVILALRHDDDVDANRAPAIYGAIIAFIGLLTVLVAVTGVVGSLVQLTADDGGRRRPAFDEEFEGLPEGGVFVELQDEDDEAITSAVTFLVVGAAALGLLRLHGRLFERRATVTGAAARVERAYLLVMCLVTALVALGAGAGSVVALYRAVLPDTAGVDNRADEIRTFVTLAVLLVGSGGLWHWHWRQVDLGPEPEVSGAAAP